MAKRRAMDAARSCWRLLPRGRPTSVEGAGATAAASYSCCPQDVLLGLPEEGELARFPAV